MTGLALALLLSACASPPAERFYTLSATPVNPPAAAGADSSADDGAGAGASGSAGAGGAVAQRPLTRMSVTPPNYYVEVTAVNVPPQVNRNQLVVSTERGQVELLEQQRWASPLAAEIGRALSLGITGELGAIDVYRSPYPEKSTVYRVSTNVQRFESAPGQRALFDVVWSVRQSGAGNMLSTCRSVIEEKVGPGYDALVAGHSRAVAQVSARIAAGIRSMAAGVTSVCPQ